MMFIETKTGITELTGSDFRVLAVDRSPGTWELRLWRATDLESCSYEVLATGTEPECRATLKYIMTIMERVNPPMVIRRDWYMAEEES